MDYDLIQKQIFANLTTNLSYYDLRTKVYEILTKKIPPSQYQDFFNWIGSDKAKKIDLTVQHANNLIISYKYFRQALDIAIVQEVIIDTLLSLGSDIDTDWHPMNGLVSDFNYINFRNHRYSMGFGNPPVVIPDNFIIKFVSAEYRSKRSDIQPIDSNILKEKSTETAKEKSPSLKKVEAYELLKKLENEEYIISEDDEVIMSHASFKGYRTRYIREELKPDFEDVFKLLEAESKIPVTNFSEYLKPPSKYYETTLVNSFQWHCNKEKGRFHDRCNGKELRSGKVNMQGKKVDALILKKN